jgi:3-hydroxybutyryl-CoA dehydrogenase
MRLDEIKTIGVVGAGQMGRGIAQVCATGGYDVLLMDVGERLIKEALSTIRVSLDRAVERGNLSEHLAQDAVARIHPLTSHMDGLSGAEVIIEAIPEDRKLKQALFADLGRAAQADTILASNTSSISISQLAAVSGRADRVVGLHFMNPAPVMQLVEIVQGPDTSQATVNVAVELTRRLGKIPVVAKDVPGFIVNRILMPMINEAVFAFEQGVASAEDIDLAMATGANHPVGPLALADRIGLDTVLAICDVLYQDLNDPKFRPCPLLRRYVEAGWLGRKSGRGFYQYEASAERCKAAKTKT